MCGIAGIVMENNAPPDSVALAAMRDALLTRGPDGSGIFVKNSVGLVHTRLSIIDLDGGKQPMSDPKGVTLVFNGEIYNYRELRQELSADYPFKTQSDTEVILALYQKFGADFVYHLRGMYAIALYDSQEDRFILTRDPFGIKPVYYVERSNSLAFSSEIKALVKSGFTHFSPDISLLRSVAVHNYAGGLTTVYPEVRRLAPGETIVIERSAQDDGRKNKNLRSFLPLTTPASISEQDAIEKLDYILRGSVNIHCRSDVGYGLFLSGGVDSACILSCLSGKTINGHGVKAYTARFDVAGAVDEWEKAAQMAKSCGVEHESVLLTAEDFKTLLPKIAAYMDDPVADYAVLPTWKLAEYAAREQKVILSGEGGDELFAGYGRHRTRWWKRFWGRKRMTADEASLTYSDSWTYLQCKQAYDIAEYLPNDLLIKLDTCLMAHGMEGRTPFLDSEVANFAFSLPDSLKVQGKQGKMLLKTWLKKTCPAARPFDKKQGFTVPVGDWIAADSNKYTALMTQSPFVKEFLSKEEWNDLPSRLKTASSAKECWRLLYLTYWVGERE